MGRKKYNKGFTLIELIVVIAILGILAIIAVPRFLSFLDQARITSDKANLRTLNTVSQFYYMMNTEPVSQVTVLGKDDSIQLQEEKLISQFLNEPIIAQFNNHHFYWYYDEESKDGRWMYSLYVLAEDINIINNLTNISIFDLDEQYGAKYGLNGSSWSANANDEMGLIATGNNNDLLFLANPKENYTINTRFILGEPNGSQYGGVGILFETGIIPGNNNAYDDTGYILQFDRHFSQVIIRPRTNGGEGNPLVRVGNHGSSNPIPPVEGYIPSRDDAWWTTEKEVIMKVEKNNQNQPMISVSIKDIGTGETIIVLNEYTHNNIVSIDDPANNHTGFRAWSSVSAEFKALDIQ